MPIYAHELDSRLDRGGSMARRVRNQKIESRSTRLKLPIKGKPIWTSVGDGIGCGYRRTGGSGSWIWRVSDGKSGYLRTEVFAKADDYEGDSDALTYWQACERAREL